MCVRVRACAADAYFQRKRAVHEGGNPGYQAGATYAMGVALVRGWFAGYAWVVRLNPDVLIYHEGPLVHALKQPWRESGGGGGVSGVFVNCANRFQAPRVHTDFFAVRCRPIYPAFLLLCVRVTTHATHQQVRPSEFDHSFFVHPPKVETSPFGADNAEVLATQAVARLLDSGDFVWLVAENRNLKGVCRVQGGGLWHAHESCPALAEKLHNLELF